MLLNTIDKSGFKNHPLVTLLCINRGYVGNDASTDFIMIFRQTSSVKLMLVLKCISKIKFSLNTKITGVITVSQNSVNDSNT